MNKYELRAVEQIEGEIKRIKDSLYPSDDTLTGFIEANYAHGFISDEQRDGYIRQGVSVKIERKEQLRRESSSSKLAALNILHGTTA